VRRRNPRRLAHGAWSDYFPLLFMNRGFGAFRSVGESVQPQVALIVTSPTDSLSPPSTSSDIDPT
jgi:hypothetical protein